MPFDYIIVGAGSAGCLLANRLSANPNHRVLLLEAGGEDTDKSIHIPIAFSKLFRSPYDWNDDSVPQAGMNNRRLFQPRGKVLGGSSSINAMIYIRGHRADYDHWAALGNKGWGYDEVLPYFRQFEQNLEFENEYHGTQGALTVSKGRHHHLLSRQLLVAAEQAGYPLNEDFNGAQQEGFGYYQVTQRGGERCSAARAFLEPVRHRSNLEVQTEATVHRILTDGKRASGVRYKRGAVMHEVEATREVLLCAGSFNSPQLLMLSGIGDGNALRKLGIEVVHHLPGVGQNLQDHLLAGCVYHTHLKNTLDSAERFPWSIRYLLQYLFLKKGLLASNVAECGGFLRSLPGQDAPDLQWHFSPSYFLRHGFDNPETGNGAGLGMTLICPYSRGQVQLQSPNPEDRPLIDPNYLSDDRDLHTLIRGYRITERIMAQPALAPYLKSRFMPPPEVETEPTLVQYFRDWAQSLYHPVGTCKMGQDEAAVVDHQLAVQGVQNLRVVDASIMPVIVRGNTNAPAMMIAEKAAAMIRNKATS
ncbi:MAG: choline dehydrogenase [Phaeodactylibacter sp.]|uniref:GMC family oxidoreductase n=1 Tax=Phaeodactylibacter sp. TaxID=1940289 RepID=UPI0032ED5CEE